MEIPYVVDKHSNGLLIESHKDRIRREVGEERWKSLFYNNFKLHLPYFVGDYVQPSFYYFIEKRFGDLDKPYGVLYPSESRYVMERLTPLYRNLTMRQFQRVVYEEMTRAQITETEIAFLQMQTEHVELFINGKTVVLERTRDVFYDLVDPIYMGLRQRGFSHQDLTR